MNYDVTVNGREGQLRLEDREFEYNGVVRDYSLASSGPGIFSVLIDGHSYQATLLAPGSIQVEGRTYSVEVFDPRELRARSAAGLSHGRQNIAAPMPGKVVRLLVAPGDAVEAGQGLIVVEAMKMQNEMKSPKAGVVVEVKTSDGATVAAGEILIVIE
ncbi:MAG TPA: biotin/lipoyl-containing protein [Bryobacteraceae bacterium]|nr:biotin/lipoyl-containing protein [Bryobacteraceae bacterium]